MNRLSGVHAGLIVVVAVLTVTAATTPVAVMTASAGDNDPTGIPDEQIFNGTDDGQIKVWERAVNPLRTDDTGAATQVPLPGAQGGGVFAEELGDGNSFNDNTDDGINAKKLVATFGKLNPAGVHDSGSIDISFNADRANSNALDGQDRVQFLAAEVTGEGGQGFPSDYSDAVTLYGDVDDANANLSFNTIEENVSLDSNGEYDTTYSNFTPGHWIVYAVVNETNANGFEVDTENNVTVDGTVTIVGADVVTIHEAQSQVTEPRSIVAGSTAKFDVDATDAFDSSEDGQVTHTVAVYNKDTFEQSQFETVINTTKLGPNFNVSNGSQLEHTIKNVQGIADVEDGIEINGRDLSDGRVESSGNLGLGAIIDRFASDLQTNEPATDPIGDTVINASVTAKSGMDRDTTIAVETLSDFESGTYQYVAVSQLDTDATKMSTDTGTLAIDKPVFSESLGTVDTNTRGDADLSQAGIGVDEVGIEPDSSVDVTVSGLSSLPSGTDQNDIESGLSNRNVEETVAVIDISLDKPDTPATVDVTIPNSAFSVDPSNLRVTKYNPNADEYESIPIVDRSTTGSTTTIEFEPDSFSTFAVAGTSEVSDGDGGDGGDGGGGLGEPTLQLYPGVTDSPDGEQRVEDITDQDPSTEGQTLEFTQSNRLVTVERIVLLNDELNEQDSATIREYLTPPETVGNDIANDVSGVDSVDVPVVVTTTIDWSEARLPQDIPDQVPGTVRLTVPRSDLNDPSTAMITYRDADGRWTQTETQLVSQTDETVTLTATVEAISVVAVSEPQADVSVSSGQLDTTSVGVGEQFTATVNLRNDDDQDRDITLTLRANGDTLTSGTVTVDAMADAQATLQASIDEAGSYDITVNGNSIGTLEVTAAETPTVTATPGATPTAEPTPMPTDTPGDSGPGFSVVVALFALLGATLLALRRRN